MERTHLTKSPIREAVIDFRCTYLEPVSIDDLEAAYGILKEAYPVKEAIDMKSLYFDVRPGNEPKMQSTEGKVGYRFASSQKDLMIQFRTDGFTFSKLRPYTSWEDVLEKAKEAYEVYRRVAKIKSINRMAVRYINVVDIETASFSDIKRYFNIYPKSPDDLDAAVDNFLLRTAFKKAELGITAVVSQGIIIEQQPLGKVSRSVLFDTDCFKEDKFSDIENPWVDLQKLKDFVNELFFKSVTTLFKETFE